MSAKAFFLNCLLLSALIIAGRITYLTYWPRSANAPLSQAGPAFNYDAPFHSGKRETLSTEITGCSDTIFNVTLNIHSEVVLAKKFLKAHEEQKTWEDAARMQTRYLFGIFNLDKSRTGGKIFLRADEIQIKINSVKEASYPSHVYVVNQWQDTPVNDYQKQAFDTKEVAAGESAVRIEYEASVPAAACGPLSELSTEVVYPKDPYLAYWQVPEGQRRLTQYRGLIETINPCAFAEMVEIKQTKWFWYTWAPSSQVCQQIVKDDSFYTTRTAKIRTNVTTKVVHDFFPKKDEYGISLIFGTLTSRRMSETFKILKENLNEKNVFDSFRNFQKLNQQTPLSDTSVLPFLFFLKEIPFLMKVGDVAFEWLGDQSLKIIIKGQQANGRRLVLDIYYGTTSIDYYPSRSYLQFVLSAFQNSDFVFYAGHAGMGRNFSLQGLAEKTGVPLRDIEEKVVAKKDQGFFIVSCYSSIYFGDDIQKARSHAGLKTLMARSASQNYLTHTLLGMINFLRQQDLNERPLKTFLEPVVLGESLFIDYYGLN